MTVKVYEEQQLIIRRGPLTEIVSLISRLNYFRGASSTSLRPGFRNCVILDLFCSNPLQILVLFFQIFWIVKLTSQNSRPASAFFFSIFYMSYHFNFPFNAQNLPFVRDCSYAITLPVSC